MLSGPFTRPCSLRMTGAWMLQSRASQNPGTPAFPAMPAMPIGPGNPRGPRGPAMPSLGSAGWPGKPGEKMNIIEHETWTCKINPFESNPERKACKFVPLINGQFGFETAPTFQKLTFLSVTWWLSFVKLGQIPWPGGLTKCLSYPCAFTNTVCVVWLKLNT